MDHQSESEETEMFENGLRIARQVTEVVRRLQRAAVTPARLARLKVLRNVAADAHGTLERILDDDTLAQCVLSDDNGIIQNGDKIMTETTETIDNLRRPFLEEIQRLCYQQRTVEELDEFYINELWHAPFPAEREKKIRAFCGRPGYEIYDLRSTWRTIDEDYKRDLLEKDARIVGLFEGLRVKHTREVAQTRHRTAVALGFTKRSPERIRAEAFKPIADLCEKTEKTVAEVFDSIDWSDTAGEKYGLRPEEYRGPRAKREHLISQRLTPDLFSQVPAGPRGKRGEVGEAEGLALLRAREVEEAITKEIYERFVVLRADISNYYQKQHLKAEREKRIKQQIAMLQKQIAA